MVIDDQLGYLKAEHILPYARPDMAQDILTYKMGEEYVIAAVLKADGKTMRLAYRKGYRVAVE